MSPFYKAWQNITAIIYLTYRGAKLANDFRVRTGRPPPHPDEIEVTPEMIEAGLDWFWDHMGDRFAINYDASEFVINLYRCNACKVILCAPQSDQRNNLRTAQVTAELGNGLRLTQAFGDVELWAPESILLRGIETPQQYGLLGIAWELPGNQSNTTQEVDRERAAQKALQS